MSVCTFFKPCPDKTLDRLVRKLPIGGIWDAFRVDGTIARKIIESVSQEFFAAQQQIYELCSELDPATTENLISEWLRSVGLPNECNQEGDTLQEQRDQVSLLLSGQVALTEQDFIDIAAFFGVNIEIELGTCKGSYVYCYPKTFYSSSAQFTWIVHFPDIIPSCGFPYSFAYAFEPNCFVRSIVECIIRLLNPAFTVVEFSYGTTPSPCC